MHMTAKWAKCPRCGEEFQAVFDAESEHSRNEAEELLKRKIERCCR